MRNVDTNFPGINKNTILKTVNSVLPKNKAVSEFGLIFVSAEKMAELNRKYRRRNKPTNVLSFALGASSGLGAGDVAICPEVVKAEAKASGFTQKNWMTRLIVHGILHLSEYDHKTQKDTAAMEGVESKIFYKLGV